MKQDMEKYQHYILKNLATSIKIMKYILILLLIIIGAKFSFRYLSPFILALFISLLIKPMASFFQSFNINKGFSVALSMILVFGGILFLLFLAISRGLGELVELANKIPTYSNELYIYFSYLFKEAENIYFQLSPDVISMILNLAKSIIDKVGIAMTEGTKAIINTLSALPRVAIFFLVSTVSTFFIAKDGESIVNSMLKPFSPLIREKFYNLKNNLFNALIGFMKAMLILLSITFIESLIGLTLMGVKYAFLISILACILDALPIVGTGSIYVPWGIVSIATGNSKLGISLLVLYAVIITVRYLVEPKVMGHQLGIHPLLTLLSMFVGIKVFGVGGVILGPTIVVTIKAAQNSDILPKFKSVED